MSLPPTLAMPPEFADPVPEAVDVAVIGGGIAGVMTGWELARAGLRTVLFEKGRIAAEQSSRNWGWIRQQGRDPDELPIMIEANRLWRGLPERLRDAIGLRQEGVLYLAETPAKLARHEAWLDHARAHGLDTVLLTGAEVAARWPALSQRYAGALWTASDLRAEPWDAVPALARAAAQDGLSLIEGCAVRGLDLAAGRVAGVVTEAGRIRADAVVLAGGAWSALFLRAHGVTIPQVSVLATAAATAPLPDLFAAPAIDSRVAWRRRADGGYTIAPGDTHDVFLGPDLLRHARAFWPQYRADPLGNRLRPAAPRGFPDAWGTPRRWALDAVSPFERCRILDPAPRRDLAARLARDVAARLPGLGQVRIARAWAGMIDTMPDVVPVLDTVAALPGLTLATGLSGHGFGIGPGIGRVVAALVRGTAPGHDLSRFRLDRFGADRPLRPGPSL